MHQFAVSLVAWHGTGADLVRLLRVRANCRLKADRDKTMIVSRITPTAAVPGTGRLLEQIKLASRLE
jgi:hypothetical protein